MLFNSYIFIFLFFPLCITGFYALTMWEKPDIAKAWLIGFSLWFYGYFSPSYLLIMIISIVSNYALTRVIRKHPNTKAPLTVGVIFNLSLLGFFKYLDFMISNLNFVLGTQIPLKNILLPLGISFFTFQQIGYLADVYKECKEEVCIECKDNGTGKSDRFIDYALFVSFFPQLVAGPIVTKKEMFPQFATLSGRRPDAEKIGRGLTLFILGLSKKVLIADAFGRAVDIGYSSIATLGRLDSFLVMIWYTMQLYFDFSGYCDMARGLAGMLGFELPVNFDSPYKASDIVDFWHRWHKTLTAFFTKYVYFPLGGSRKGTVRTIINILIVYFLSGLWHGAGWNFVFWGMLHGVAYAVVRTIKRRSEAGNIKELTGLNGENRQKIKSKYNLLQRLSRIVSHTATFLYVSFAWVFFRASSITEGWALIKNMFTGTSTGINYALADAFARIDELWYIVKFSGLPNVNFPLAHNLVMILFTLCALIVVFAAPNAAEISGKIRPRVSGAICIGLVGIWCVLSLSEVSTFLYFNF
ncbi:MAG: MBOAT family protein [Lachnospiraceae bacterium]|nr:MBOAT family protein [Lachnospiraceae bacterium]